MSRWRRKGRGWPSGSRMSPACARSRPWVRTASVSARIQQIKYLTPADPFLFLRVFTRAGGPLPLVALLSFLVPLVAIGLCFDLVTSDHNQRTLSRVLSQPIYRDALLLGKF